MLLVSTSCERQKRTMCSPNVELFTVSMRPFYLPREFTHVIVTCVYVPPSGNPKEAAGTIGNHIHALETSSPDALKIVTGDFNQCSHKVSSACSDFQHVDCPTSKDRILDLCNSNVRNAYSSVPLGRSDHNIVHLTPENRPVVH